MILNQLLTRASESLCYNARNTGSGIRRLGPKPCFTTPTSKKSYLSVLPFSHLEILQAVRHYTNISHCYEHCNNGAATISLARRTGKSKPRDFPHNYHLTFWARPKKGQGDL